MATNILVDGLFEKVKDAISNQQPTESENSNKNLQTVLIILGIWLIYLRMPHFPKNVFFAQELWNASFLHK